MNQQNLASDIWNIADTLRGDFKQSEFGRVILPFAVLRRLECVLEPTRQAVLEYYKAIQNTGIDLDLVLPTIELLKERRSALITVAVTGQIDLRESEISAA